MRTSSQSGLPWLARFERLVDKKQGSKGFYSKIEGQTRGYEKRFEGSDTEMEAEDCLLASVQGGDESGGPEAVRSVTGLVRRKLYSTIS